MRRFLSLSALVVSLFVFAGCGGGAKKGGVLKGTVVLPPNVKLGESDSATLSFVPEGGAGERFSATIKPADMTFSTTGDKGKGLPPGKYKITVMLQPYMHVEGKVKAALDFLNDKYDNDKSNLSYTVTDEKEQSITVDLAKGTVTKP